MIRTAADIIKSSKYTCVFTGAGVSVESGIPPFRGENGLWNKIDPVFLDINYFYKNSLRSWELIKKIFYDFFGKAKPNNAHIGIAELEKKGYVKSIITQNIDNLHQLAGSKTVYEFHGNSRYLICTECKKKYNITEIDLEILPPKCENCNGLLKPDFVFFGEPIPEPARTQSFKQADIADVFLLIGTTGEIQPASMIPFIAKKNNAKIIEINVEPSNYTNITDVFLNGKATEIIKELLQNIK
jgi:NAD-dependent deacetylase